MLQYFLLFIIFVKSAVIYGFNEIRIQNGEITPPDLFQFTARLRSPCCSCTASVISKRHILTAAHCIYYVESRKIKYDRYQEFLDIIYHAGIHPKSEVEYDKSKLPNTTTVYVPITRKPPFEANTDIAVVEFPEDTDFGVEPVKLAKDYLEKEGDEAYIIGYGGWWEIGKY
uniref:Peptidase S1 domain-containing protein n=1 Tax=Panagrolaimus davidi TaxID=227884 RepID=A0A914QX62_9BILA